MTSGSKFFSFRSASNKWTAILAGAMIGIGSLDGSASTGFLFSAVLIGVFFGVCDILGLLHGRWLRGLAGLSMVTSGWVAVFEVSDVPKHASGGLLVLEFGGSEFLAAITVVNLVEYLQRKETLA